MRRPTVLSLPLQLVFPACSVKSFFATNQIKSHFLKVDLQYDDYFANLVGFKVQKKYFTFIKPANLARFLPKCKHGFKS